MNPVDHPHGGVSYPRGPRKLVVTELARLTCLDRVTINISVRRPRSRDTLCPVRRRVLLLREERVCSVVPRRRRSKGSGRDLSTSPKGTTNHQVRWFITINGVGVLSLHCFFALHSVGTGRARYEKTAHGKEYPASISKIILNHILRWASLL